MLPVPNLRQRAWRCGLTENDAGKALEKAKSMKQTGLLLLILAFIAGVVIQQIPNMISLAGLLDSGRIIAFLVGLSLFLIGRRRVKALS
jgi:hypothetical protein